MRNKSQWQFLFENKGQTPEPSIISLKLRKELKCLLRYRSAENKSRKLSIKSNASSTIKLSKKSRKKSSLKPVPRLKLLRLRAKPRCRN